MKRHLRVTVERLTLIGQLIAKSGWHDSGRIDGVTVRSFKAGRRVTNDYSAILGEALDIVWDCRCGAMNYRDGGEPSLRAAAHPALEWLEGNADGRWLITHSGGDGSACANIWFESLDDATLFRTAGFGARI